MPDLPQQPMLPNRPDATRRWAESLTLAVVRIWAQLTNVINLLSQTGTLAQRRATPVLNHIFYTTTDTLQTYVGVEGEWAEVGSVRGSDTVAGTSRRGAVAIGAGASTATVTLTPVESDTSYRVFAVPAYNAGAVWVTTKAVGSFVINVGTVGPGGGSTLDWLLVR